MAKTTNLGLNLTETEDIRFGDWVNSIDGNNADDRKSNMQIIDDFAGAIYGVSGVVTLESSKWTDSVYTLTLVDLGDHDAVFFSPVGLGDKTALEKTNSVVSANGNTVIFAAEIQPSKDISLNYFISRGKG